MRPKRSRVEMRVAHPRVLNIETEVGRLSSYSDWGCLWCLG